MPKVEYPGSKREEPTEALVTVNSTSPFAALISSTNFSQTPFNSPSLLFSANVSRKFLTVLPLSPPAPVCFCSSAMMADLSAAESVGASRIEVSLGSLMKTSLSVARAREVDSRVEVLTAAVYYFPPYQSA